MEHIKSKLSSPRWLVVTGVSMGAGVAMCLALGVAPFASLLCGAVLPFVGAFAQVLDEARG